MDLSTSLSWVVRVLLFEAGVAKPELFQNVRVEPVLVSKLAVSNIRIGRPGRSVIRVPLTD